MENEKPDERLVRLLLRALRTNYRDKGNIYCF
jgi:hypothetical protein